MLDMTKDPCFNDFTGHLFGRVHLPVAPKCNIQCNFCSRQFDCMNKSRPGVTSAILSPAQAMHYLDKVVRRDSWITVVGIAGPGDPFANADETLETVRLVRERYPGMLLCVASNGLSVAPHVDELACCGVSHVTITINAVDPEIGAKVYAWVRDGVRIRRGFEGATLLRDRQLQAVRLLASAGITVKINTILIPGVNDAHVGQVARKVASLGAGIFNCIPIYPVANTPMETTEQPSVEMLAAARAEAEQYLPQMRHCTRCRTDAVGLLGEEVTESIAEALRESAAAPLNPAEHRPYVAVTSMEGLLVNEHLGQAKDIWIFRQVDGECELLEKRRTPPPGGGSVRWSRLAETLRDCRALLTAAAGTTPRLVLTHAGLRVVEMEGLVDSALAAVYRGEEIRCPSRKVGCGSGCPGLGTGCG